LKPEAPFDLDNPPWIKNYDPHVPARVEVPDMLLHEMLSDIARRYPEASAVTFMGQTLSYRELYEQVLRVANALSGLGLSVDDKIALILPNTPHFITIAFQNINLAPTSASKRA